MKENRLELQNIPTKRIAKKTDYLLQFGQMAEKEEKATTSHFLKFLFANQANGIFGFSKHTTDPLQDLKCQFLTTH